MRRHADLWRRKIEDDLNHYDQPNVSQALFRLWHMMMSRSKSGPRADDSHDTPRRTNKLNDLYETDYRQTHNTCAGDKPGNQIAHGEPNCAYGSFQRRGNNKKNAKCVK